MKKKGLHTKTINVFNPENGDEFEIFVTFEILDNDFTEDESFFYDDEIDIKSYESVDDEEIPEWVDENLVFISLLEELQIEEENGMFNDDFLDGE